jgi:AAA15 family ATPase/GTPase
MSANTTSKTNLITDIRLENFGPLKEVAWNNLGQVNLIIGNNKSGKTFLLKSLYSAMKTVEMYNRGKSTISCNDYLAEKLYWTFEVEKLGSLVNNTLSTAAKKDKLSFALSFNQKTFEYGFGKTAEHKIQSSEVKNTIDSREQNSVFLPAKEVLSLKDIIDSTEDKKLFGFDATYRDLISALRPKPVSGGKNFKEFSDAQNELEKILGGRLEYHDEKKAWLFNSNGKTDDLGVTAEGVKKISILDVLLSNGYLSPEKSIVFMDEVESALHPRAISRFLEIITQLSKCGMQFFLSSHSYFVVKKLYLIAQKEKMSIPVLSEKDGKWTPGDMLDEMPENEIIDESIELYKQKMEIF